MNPLIKAYNDSILERAKLREIAVDAQRDFAVRGTVHPDDENEKVRVVKKPRNKKEDEFEDVKRKLRESDAQPVALLSTYNRNNFPKKSKCLFDEIGHRYYPLDGKNMYAFRLKHSGMSLPNGLTHVLIGGRGEKRRVYIENAVLGLNEGNKWAIGEIEDVKPSIVCGTCDVAFI
jgi:hypothetical protein